MISAIISFVVLALFAAIIWFGLKTIFVAGGWIVGLFFFLIVCVIAYVVWSERK